MRLATDGVSDRHDCLTQSSSISKLSVAEEESDVLSDLGELSSVHISPMLLGLPTLNGKEGINLNLMYLCF